MIGIQKLLFDAMTSLEQLDSYCNRPHSLQIAYRDIDRLIQGFIPGEVITIASRPGHGTTSFALRLASHFGRLHNVLFLHSEPVQNLVMKLLSQKTQIPLSRIAVGKFKKDEWASLSETVDFLLPTKINFHPLSVPVETPKENPSVIIVDGYSFDEIKLADIKALYPEAVIILIAAVKPNVDMRPNKRPLLCEISDNKEDLSYLSDYVFFLYRDELYNRGSEDAKIIEVILAKSRNSGCYTIRLNFDEDTCRMSDYVSA